MAIGKLPDDDDGGGDGGDAIFAEINITPLTDVFLVMVIIFMVSALAVQVEAGQEKKKITQQVDKMEDQKKSGLKIDLPHGTAQDIDPSKVSLVLEVPLTGDIVVAGKTLTEGEVDNLFRAAYTRDKGTQVIIKADKGVTHGRIVNLMEHAKAVGLTHLAFGTGAGP